MGFPSEESILWFDGCGFEAGLHLSCTCLQHCLLLSGPQTASPQPDHKLAWIALDERCLDEDLMPQFCYSLLDFQTSLYICSVGNFVHRHSQRTIESINPELWSGEARELCSTDTVLGAVEKWHLSLLESLRLL